GVNPQSPGAGFQPDTPRIQASDQFGSAHRSKTSRLSPSASAENAEQSSAEASRASRASCPGPQAAAAASPDRPATSPVRPAPVAFSPAFPAPRVAWDAWDAPARPFSVSLMILVRLLPG